MFCGSCGAENHETNRYCVSCRTDLTKQGQSVRPLRDWQNDKWATMLRERAWLKEWERRVRAQSTPLWLLWFPLSIVLIAGLAPRRAGFLTLILLWLAIFYAGGVILILPPFFFFKFGHPRNWPIYRDDELEAYASGHRNIGDYQPSLALENHNLGKRSHDMANSTGSIGAGIVWMFIISILLFWLPVIGPLLAGLVGGKKSGGVGNAVAAVFLPGVVFGLLLFFLASSLTGVPLVGAIAGVGGIALSLVHIGPLLVGAIIGGLIA